MRLRAGAFSLSFAVLAAATGHAQSPPAPLPATQSPLPGFVPPYEISKIVRSAGFSPLSPPLREGTTYVLRATDYRGILMRVVVDARSGAIRAVNRIVPAYEVGMMGPPYGEPSPYGVQPIYGPPSYRPPGYGPPAVAAPDMGPEEADFEPSLGPPPPGYPLAPPAGVRPASLQTSPPLPRPRPPELAARDLKPAAKQGDAKPVEARPVEARPVEAKPSEPPAVKADTKPDVSAAPPPVATATPAAKRPLPPAIQD